MRIRPTISARRAAKAFQQRGWRASPLSRKPKPAPDAPVDPRNWKPNAHTEALLAKYARLGL